MQIDSHRCQRGIVQAELNRHRLKRAAALGSLLKGLDFTISQRQPLGQSLN